MSQLKILTQEEGKMQERMIEDEVNSSELTANLDDSLASSMSKRSSRLSWREIPTVLFTVFGEYLTRTEYLQLMNTSKALFHDIKRETSYYNLGYTASILYCKDASFRQFILNQVHDSSKQIALNLFSHYNKHLNQFYQHATNVHKLMIRDVEHATSVDLFGTIEELTVQGFEKLRKIQNFEKVKIFKIYDCPAFQSLSYRGDCLQDVLISNCRGLRHSRGLERVPVVAFHYCRNLQDISTLGRFQKQLTLRGCTKIVSVNHLGQVSKLSISDCPEVVDVSALGNVPSLEIDNCRAIPTSSIALLNNNPRLKLASLDIDSFYNVGRCEHLELVSLPIDDLQKGDLSSCKDVHLRNCERVIDVSPLRSIESVYLFRCHHITDVSCLGGVKSLKIEVCKGITNLNGLGTVPTIFVYLCEKLTNISELGQNIKVTISTCIHIEDFSSLRHVESVTLIDCPQLTTAAPFEDVTNLKLERCNSLVDVSMLGKVKNLWLVYCHHLQSLRGLENVQKLSVVGCKVDDTAGLEKKRNVTIK